MGTVGDPRCYAEKMNIGPENKMDYESCNNLASVSVPKGLACFRAVACVCDLDFLKVLICTVCGKSIAFCSDQGNHNQGDCYAKF
jgi:hypothetical protein